MRIPQKLETILKKWFKSMAECIHGNDFEDIKPSGPRGDKKCDGRIISEDTIIQCYAPESPRTFSEKASSKINDSFPDIVKIWPNMKKWVFLHNNDAGIPVTVSETLDQVRNKYPMLTIEEGSKRYLKDNYHDKLSGQQLIDIYPDAAIKYNLSIVQMEHIRPLLSKISAVCSSTPAKYEFGEEPDSNKLDFNKLSSPAQINIRLARQHVDIVDRYLSSLNNPQNATKIQLSIRKQYQDLRDFGHNSEQILAMMLQFVGDSGEPIVRAAAYVIVTYFFDSCDIFENPPKVSEC